MEFCSLYRKSGLRAEGLEEVEVVFSERPEVVVFEIEDTDDLAGGNQGYDDFRPGLVSRVEIPCVFRDIADYHGLNVLGNPADYALSELELHPAFHPGVITP